MAGTNGLKSEFLQSIKCGTGRAYILAKANPGVDFSDYIIQAALKNFAYDGQAEGSRAQYIYSLHCISKQQERIRRATLKGLAEEQKDTWTLTQLFGLALLFAQNGDTKARAAIYKRFNPFDRADWAGAAEIMTLDGLAGLEHIARKFGKALAKDPNNWQDDYLIQSFQKEYPAVDAWGELKRLAEQDEDVRRYLQNIEATLANQAVLRPSSVASELEEMLQVPHQAHMRFALRRRNLEPQKIQQMAERLLTEKNKAVRENLLYVFTLFRYPLAHQPLLLLASQRPSGKDRITEFALDALKFLQAPEIREFALQRLSTTTRPYWYTDILISNYREGDAKLLTGLINRFHNEHTIEELARSYIEIYKANKTSECAVPLMALYQKMNCGIHRSILVELLIQSNSLPDWLNKELPFDSYAETQRLHQPQR